MTKALARTAQDGADHVNKKLADGAAAVVAVGQALVDEKNALEHGEWDRMFAGHLRAVKRPIEMSRQSAHKYMTIARNLVLANVAHVRHLPASWGTLSELAKVPEKKLQRALGRGLITPDMQRKDVKLLMPPRTTTDPGLGAHEPDRSLKGEAEEKRAWWAGLLDMLLQGQDKDYDVEALLALARKKAGEARAQA